MSNTAATGGMFVIKDSRTMSLAQYKQRELLRDKLCAAAITWANNDKGFTRIVLRGAAFDLWKFDQQFEARENKS
jgi:hypothetical protein